MLSTNEYYVLKKLYFSLFQKKFPWINFKKFRDYFADFPPPNYSPMPFIVGQGRSGTTLLRLMLDSHSQLAIPPETDFIPPLLALTYSSNFLREDFLETISSHWRWPDFHLDEQIFNNTLQEIPYFTITKGIRLFYQLYANRFGKNRWGDKTPYYVYFMKQIQNQIPEARFIHIIRDGRDSYLSAKPLWFGKKCIIEAATTWKQTVEFAREQIPLLNFYLEVKYEDFLKTPEPILRKICEFLALPWDANMLNYHLRAKTRIDEEISDYYSSELKLVVLNAERRKVHERTQQTLQLDRIARWKKELNQAEQQIFINIAGETLSQLGYEI